MFWVTGRLVRSLVATSSISIFSISRSKRFPRFIDANVKNVYKIGGLYLALDMRYVYTHIYIYMRDLFVYKQAFIIASDVRR